MSVITLPVGLRIASFGVGQARYDMQEASDTTGHQAARLLGPPRWRFALASPQAMPFAQAAQWQALVLKLRGGVNHLAMGDPVRKVPRGTMRGTLVLTGSHAAGATSLSIAGGAGQAGTTLLQGDWLQVGTGLGTSQLVQVVADATADGSGDISATFEPPLRIAYAGSTSVTWNGPLGYFKSIGGPQWAYAEGQTAGGFTLDLLEAWT